jgi:His-Xaa-Ser system protein HxsD
MNDFIKEVGNGKLQIQYKKDIYAKDAILASIYKFKDKCNIYLDSDESNFVIYFFDKQLSREALEEIAIRFNDDIVDQQIRINTESKYKHIRDLIVEKAFKPINS